MKFVDSKSMLQSPVVYATDRSKAVVPVLFLFCVALWFILRGASYLVLPCSRIFFSPFIIAIISDHYNLLVKSKYSAFDQRLFAKFFVSTYFRM